MHLQRKEVNLFSRFEKLVFGRLDIISQYQRSHNEYCATRFQYLDGQIKAIQEQLGDMCFG